MLAISRGDEKDRILTAVLRVSKYFDGTPQDHFADLRAKVLKGAPADRVKREVARRAMRAPRLGCHSFGLVDRHRHAAATP